MAEGGEELNSNMIFEFPIRYPKEESPKKNIPHSSLPIFYGLTSEDLDTLLFEFGVLCHSNDYTSDAKKPKLFPATLKEPTL